MYLMMKLVFSPKPLVVGFSSHKGRGRAADLGVREREVGGMGGGEGPLSPPWVPGNCMWVSIYKSFPWICICVQHGNTHSRVLHLFRLYGEELFSCPLEKKLCLATAVMELLLLASWFCPKSELSMTLAQVSAISSMASHRKAQMPVTLSASVCHELHVSCVGAV